MQYFDNVTDIAGQTAATVAKALPQPKSPPGVSPSGHSGRGYQGPAATDRVKEHRGRWMMRVRGRRFYFGRVADDPSGLKAQDLWQSQREEILERTKRNLMPPTKEARQKLKATAVRLRCEDPQKWTMRKIGKLLDVPFETVRAWVNGGSEADSPDDVDA
jgi:hypothetical protein